LPSNWWWLLHEEVKVKMGVHKMKHYKYVHIIHDRKKRKTILNFKNLQKGCFIAYGSDVRLLKWKFLPN